MNLLWPVDYVVDRITMYRLMLYYLIGLLLVAMGLNMLGDLRYSWWSIALSASIIVAVCWGSNKIFGWLFRAPINDESALITSAILALIITPDITKLGIVFMIAASIIATASKYIFAINRKHVFNPAAIAVFLTAIAANQTPSWWVGSAVMLPYVLVGGLIIARKIRRLQMIGAYLVVTSLATAALAYIDGNDPLGSLRNMALSSAAFFLGFVMLTEPQTSPTERGKQFVYATIVGILLPPQVHILQLYSSPEFALLVGNLFAYFVSTKEKLLPILKRKREIATNTLEFEFAIDEPLSYLPGQYMEWTLPHAHKDSRGERRYFTLASSPTEPGLKLGIKVYEPGSSYKRAMLDATSEALIAAGQLAGDFVMPGDQTKKLAFVAGGIGITPFRSMIKYLLDTNERRDIVLLYSARTRRDVAYGEIFEEANAELGLKTIYVLDGESAQSAKSGTYTATRLTPEIITREIPDYQERTFYISGTHAMVSAVKHDLRKLGVPSRQIMIDFFPGYA